MYVQLDSFNYMAASIAICTIQFYGNHYPNLKSLVFQHDGGFFFSDYTGLGKCAGKAGLQPKQVSRQIEILVLSCIKYL